MRTKIGSLFHFSTRLRDFFSAPSAACSSVERVEPREAHGGAIDLGAHQHKPVAFTRGDDVLEALDLPRMLGKQLISSGQFRARGADGGVGTVAVGEDLRLHGIELRGGFLPLRFGFGDGAFVLTENRQSQADAERPFVFAGVELVAGG
jgi:hypothetical protein